MGDGVNVSMDAVFAELRENSKLLAVLGVKVDDLSWKLESLKTDHEIRIRALEMHKWLFSGAAMIFGALASPLIAMFIK